MNNLFLHYGEFVINIRPICDFSVKVPSSGRTTGKLACILVLTFDGLTRMSKQGDSPDCEFRGGCICAQHSAADFHRIPGNGKSCSTFRCCSPIISSHLNFPVLFSFHNNTLFIRTLCSHFISALCPLLIRTLCYS